MQTNRIPHTGKYRTQQYHIEVGASSQATIVIFRDRVLRYTFLRKVYDHTALSLYNRMCEVFDTLPATLRKTCTYDNGKENVLHESIKGTSIYSFWKK